MHRKIFHLALAAAALCASPLYAQIHKVAAPEAVTRAIGVYEYTGTLEKPVAARIIPITLFINDRLEDAGTYLTRPMPLALQTGVIYSIEQAGKPLGTVTLDYARHSLPPGVSPDIAEMGDWFGYGSFALPAKPKPSSLSASAKIAPISGGSDNPDDDRPHFTGRQPGDGNSTPAPASTSASTPANPAPADDPDRPHLAKREPATPASTQTPIDTSGTTDPDASDPDRPTLKHRDLPPDEPETRQKKQKHSDSAVLPMSTSLNEDPDRPTLKRGKPVGLVSTAELVGLPPNLHQTAAVSDAANRDAHVFARPWETHTEHAEIQVKLAALAQPLIAKYEAENKLTPPASVPATTPSKPTLHTSTLHTTKKPTPPAAPSITLNAENVTGFELTYGGLPTFVYTAESPITTGGPVYVTLVAQLLPTGELQTALSSVTDASHLDRVPWMRLVDAIDPDAGHRASLLFELRAANSRQFALYRLITAHAEQQFITGIIQ